MPFTLTDILYAAAMGAALGSVATIGILWRMQR